MEEEKNDELNSKEEKKDKEEAAALKKKLEDALWEERKNKFLEDLQNNPKYKPFIERYNRYSIPGFLDSWAREKASLLRDKDYYVKYAERYETRYAENAKKKLWEIQQRKLFDLQCQWRAKEIELPGVEIVWDFSYWEENIQNCPFLTPITQVEFDRYLSFVEKSSYDDVIESTFYDSDWQEYDDYKQSYLNEKEGYREPPPWYEYYELVTGLSKLYLLEDYKGASENKYMNAYREDRDKENQSNTTNTFVPDNRPMIYNTGENYLEEFIKTYEDPNTYYLFKCKEIVENSDVDDDLREALETLTLADEKIFLSPDKEWRDSIIYAANEYERRRLIRELPNAYKSYLFRIKNNIPFEANKKDLKWYEDFRMQMREYILKGRELLGEPRDFNY